MKDLKKHSEEIYKCTKCGLCQAACPIFEETGMEGVISRGKFSLLNGVIKKDLTFSKKISNYLEICLGCNACSEFCPSGINVEEIIISARQEAYKLKHTGLIKKSIISIFNSKIKLNIIKFLIFLYKNSGLMSIASVISPFVPYFGKYISLLNSQLKTRIKYTKLKPKKPKSSLKVVYFPGCINNYINPSVKNAIKTVFEYNGINALIPDFDCCGIPARSAGDLEKFKNLAKSNLDKIDSNIDYLITDCATCGTVWNLYAEVLDGEYKEKAEFLAQKAININKFLVKINFSVQENFQSSKKVTYHDPCHLKRFQGVYEEPREVLKRIPGVELVEMENPDKCCGAAGTFCMLNQNISVKISSKKAQNIIKTGANIVATSCPSCNIGLSQGLIEQKFLKPVYQPVELIAENIT